MSDFSQAGVRNLLLRVLSREAFEYLRPEMRRVELPVKFQLVAPNTPVETVVFIEEGLGSVVAASADDEVVEVGHIGYEGMSGAHALLRVDSTPCRTFMQVGGTGISLPIDVLTSVTSKMSDVNELFLRYTHTSHVQLAHTALANARYNMHERLARWLLMVHDRVQGDSLPLTHEFLSLMMGVRRSGVTQELHVLEGLSAIKATRGNIRVTDRAKLEEIAGGSYGVPEEEYERLVGLPIRRRHD